MSSREANEPTTYKSHFVLDVRAEAVPNSGVARGRSVPVLVSAHGVREELVRLHLGSGHHNEGWLQELIHTHPSVLPVSEIEPGFGQLISAAREVSCDHGTIDNLYVTPSGDILLVETKLWRNAQMRREVVAQALDYVAALTAMPFEAFEQAVCKGQSIKRLYDLVADHADALSEQDFIDAISFNLRRGRILVMVAGDGIRTETEALVGLLQSHAGAHFTFALVELATWETPAGDILVVPDIMTKTVMIERGVVRLEGSGLTVTPVAQPAKAKAANLSLVQFWEAMAKLNTSLPGDIQQLLDQLEPLGVFSDMKAALNLKLDVSEWGKPVNLGYIRKDGVFWPNQASSDLPKAIWESYSKNLAELVGGEVVEKHEKFVAVAGKPLRIDQLVPAHTSGYVSAVVQVAAALKDEVKKGAEPFYPVYTASKAEPALSSGS